MVVGESTVTLLLSARGLSNAETDSYLTSTKTRRDGHELSERAAENLASIQREFGLDAIGITKSAYRRRVP